MTQLGAIAATKGMWVPAGKSIIATTESRTNTAYGTLTTPDQVTGVVLPTDGLISVLFQATWQESVANAARAAIFVGANQLRIVYATSTPNAVQEASINPGAAATVNTDRPLSTFPGGLWPDSTANFISAGANADTGPVTTGQVVANGQLVSGGVNQVMGGPAYIFAAAGTYTISVQFKASSGSVTAKNRKLWVNVAEY